MIEAENSPESYLVNAIDGIPISSILDVGTGPPGVFNYGWWEAQDILKTCLDVKFIREDISKKWNRVFADAVHLPFRDKCFDHVQSTEMIEHIAPEFHRKVLRELKRVSIKTVFVTASGLQSHLGEPQIEAEAVNPFQKYREMVSKSLFLEEGFNILLNIDEAIIDKRLLKLYKEYAAKATPLNKHIKAIFKPESPTSIELNDRKINKFDSEGNIL